MDISSLISAFITNIEGIAIQVLPVLFTMILIWVGIRTIRKFCSYR